MTDLEFRHVTKIVRIGLLSLTGTSAIVCGLVWGERGFATALYFSWAVAMVTFEILGRVDWGGSNGIMQISVGKEIVWWQQRMPTKDTNGHNLVFWGCVIIVGIAILDASSMNRFLWGAGLGMLMFWIVYRGLKRLVGVQSWADMPTVEVGRGVAFSESAGDTELFVWRYSSYNLEGVFGHVPMDQFNSFELVDYYEWFESSRRPLNAWAIAIHLKDGGSRCIAVHAGPKAELSELHAALTRKFLGGVVSSPETVVEASTSDIPYKL